MLGEIITVILNALDQSGRVASAAGSLSPALSALSSYGSAMSPYSSALSSLGSLSSQVTGMVNSQSGGGGVTGTGTIGQRPTVAPGSGSGTPIGLTADSARTGLANLKSQGQASGLSGLSDDAYIDQLAQQFGVEPDQVRKMLGGEQLGPGQGVYNG